MNTTANTTDHGYITAYAAGGGTVRHIVAVTGDYYGGYADTAVCGTSPRIRWSNTRWTGENGRYSTPAVAAESSHLVCKRCAAAVAKMTPAESTPAPAESLEENTMNTPATNPILEAHKSAAARRVASQFAMTFPALTGDVVMQGHADYCRDNGHATHTVTGTDGAVDVSPWCPRCGSSIAEYTRGERVLALEALIESGAVSEDDAPALEDVPAYALEAVKAAKATTGVENLNHGFMTVFDATVDALKARAAESSSPAEYITATREDVNRAYDAVSALKAGTTEHHTARIHFERVKAAHYGYAPLDDAAIARILGVCG